jgi:hypothetical protein
MSIWPGGKRPSEQVFDVLHGRIRLEDAPASIQSLCSKYIYEGAKDILSRPTKEARRKALSNIPALIRPHVEAEATRIYRGER